MAFYKFADKTDPFPIQWYRKDGELEVCGHNQLPLKLIKRVATAKKNAKEMESGSIVNCATSGFLTLVLKRKQHLSRSFSLTFSFHVYIKVFYYLQFNGNWLPLFFLKIIY